MSVGLVAGGAAIVGGIMQADAASDAADAQANAANQSDATQRYFYDTTRADNAPFREAGVAANNRLAYLLGLSPNGGASAGGQTANSLAGQRLVDTTGGVPRYNVDLYNNNPAYRAAWDDLAATHYRAYNTDYNQTSNSNWIEQGLRGRLEAQISQDSQAADAAAQNDPEFGSLMRNFTAADMEADPVYQSGLEFGLSEGTKGVNRLAAASGSLNSGATLKALTRFGNDYASTKANDSYNRFNTNQTNQYNRLAGLSGAGQQATSQVSAAGQNMANNISQNQIGVGNARAASSIGRANAITGGLSQGWNMYQQNQMMNKLFPQQSGGWVSQG